MTDTPKTALVTGATSGLGFEGAVQAANAGYQPVTITGRTADKAEAARKELVSKTGKDVFETLTLDLGSSKSVRVASEELASRGRSIDYLLLNAGIVAGNSLTKTDEGVEITSASSVIGHHQLTMHLLEAGLLGSKARIVLAGSEAARGDVPTMTPVDLPALAKDSYGGNLVTAAEDVIRAEAPIKYSSANVYATTKLFSAYWAAELATKLPAGMAVNAVSPGSAPDTNAIRNAPWFMKYIMVPVFKLAPERMGMAGSVPDAAARYLEVAGYGDDVSGEFFASAPKKMTGPLHKVDLPHVNEKASQEAAWEAIVKVAGNVNYPTTV